MKKALSVLLSVLLVLALGVTAFAKIFPPDPDGDGRFTWKDARIITRVVWGFDTYSSDSEIYKACDFNGDGTVNSGDLRDAMRYAAGMDAGIYVENPFDYDAGAEVIDYDFSYFADGEDVTVVITLPEGVPIEGGDFVVEYDGDAFSYDMSRWNTDKLFSTDDPFSGETNNTEDGNARAAFCFAKSFTPAEATELVRFDFTGNPGALNKNYTFSLRLRTGEALTVTVPYEGGVKPGDVDGDGFVSWKDARIILRHISDISPIPEQVLTAFTAADINGNGQIDATDLRTVMRLAAGLDASVWGEHPYDITDQLPAGDYALSYRTEEDSVTLIVGLPAVEELEGGDFTIGYSASTFDFSEESWNNNLSSSDNVLQKAMNGEEDGEVRGAFCFSRSFTAETGNELAEIRFTLGALAVNGNYDFILTTRSGDTVKVTVPVTNAIKPGDVDLDGLVTWKDARDVSRAALGTLAIPMNTKPYAAADMDGNGLINGIDMRKVSRLAVGLDADIWGENPFEPTDKLPDIDVTANIVEANSAYMLFVNLKEQEFLMGGDFTVSYDKTAFTLTGTAWNSGTLNSEDNPFTSIFNDETEGTARGAFWFFTPIDVTDVTNLAKLDFTRLPEAENRDYTFTVTLRSGKSVSVTLAHTHEAGEPAKENETPATCTAGGEYDLVTRCTVCGEALATEHKTVPANGHSFGAWTEKTPATTEAEGEEIRVCSACGATESRPIAKLEPSDPVVTADNIGDVDGDGSVTAADARLALRRAVELETFTEEQFARADVDFDGQITAGDARHILRAAVELEDRKDWIKN